MLSALRKECVGQSLFQADGKAFDRFEGRDGSELWFDVTDSFARIRPQAPDAS